MSVAVASNPDSQSSSTTGRRLSAGDMLRYGVGQTGAQIFRDTPAALLPVFMTTMLGVPAWMAGVAILLPKLWVILCDPLMGAWSDRSAPRVGRTPFLAFGALATALGFFSLFSITGYSSPVLAAVSVSLIFLLAMTGFSAFSVPHLAIAAELSSDPHERTRIVVYRMIFVTAGVLLGVGVAQPLVYHFGGGARGWFMMASIYAVVCLVTMLATAIGVRPLLRGRRKAAGTPLSLGTQLKAAAANRPFRLLTIIHLLQTIGQACSYTVVALVFIYLVDNIALLMSYILVMSFVGISMQPVWLRVTRHMGKLPLFLWLVLGWCAITATWLWIDWGSDMPIALPVFGEMTVKDAMILLRGALIGVTNSGFIMLITALFTDTIQFDGSKDAAAVEGGYAGVWSATEKVGFALGPLVSGVVLSFYGFQSSQGGAVEQSGSALFGIIACYSVVPLVFFAASLALVPAFARSIAVK